MDALTYLNNHFVDSHMLADVFISVGMIGIGISIFFFTYAATIEEKIVISQTKIVINDLMQTIRPLLTTEQRKNLAENISIPNNKKEDLEALNNNNALISNAYTKLLLIFVVSIGIGLALSIVYKHNFYYLILLNTILLAFVMLTEFTFVHLIPEKIIIADTNWVRWKIISEIRSKIILK
jgi:hypothetical protein